MGSSKGAKYRLNSAFANWFFAKHRDKNHGVEEPCCEPDSMPRLIAGREMKKDGIDVNMM